MQISPDYKSAEHHYAKLPTWARQEVSSSTDRFAYIMGALEMFRPVRMVEVGVSAGALSSALLFKARQYTEQPLLYGIDLGSTCYFNGSRRIGEILGTAFPELEPFHELHTGNTALDSDELMQGPIDFIYIDANHSHPWASIDCLCLLPHLADRALIGFHDTALLATRANSGLFTFRSMKAEKFHDETYDLYGTGFCIFEKNKLDDILHSLLLSFILPWETEVSPSDVDRIVRFAGKHFGEEFRRRLQDIMLFWSEHVVMTLEIEEKKKQHLLAPLYGSTSWKLTAPLRWAGSLLGKA